MILSTSAAGPMRQRTAIHLIQIGGALRLFDMTSASRSTPALLSGSEQTNAGLAAPSDAPPGSPIMELKRLSGPHLGAAGHLVQRRPEEPPLLGQRKTAQRRQRGAAAAAARHGAPDRPRRRRE